MKVREAQLDLRAILASANEAREQIRKWPAWRRDAVIAAMGEFSRSLNSKDNDSQRKSRPL